MQRITADELKDPEYRGNIMDKSYSCSVFRDCAGCLGMAPTCRWCVRGGGRIPRCEHGHENDRTCSAWYASGLHECPTGK
ncbi:unnamed protein product [Didymodactylos carnosus]|uniref:Uncharacterized protein n=1 Tax=Didymodactylos carnosus TaxID=1234261 RepID=A0A815NQ54_9BILA|nr:unnamed protein product [Didymodactylos carnosus]CAF1441299.1 unnamed protein product [Didymodactylos carnosus]CAF3719453.1 unnamed protein product [Didymodactylos carnosus]CAF4317371.1 unnamed protein product [Didymodactylos carnosus]